MTAFDSMTHAGASAGVLAETFTMEEVAALLECTPETIVARIESGDLAGVKFGRSWIFPRAAFLQRLNEHALEVAARRREQRITRAQQTLAAPTPAPSETGGQRGRAMRRVPPPLPPIPRTPASIEQVPA